MPTYLTPGVKIEEQPAPQTIQGVSTSQAGFVGAARRGQTVGLPQLVYSFEDFQRKYGGHLGEEWGDARFLGFGVEAFFVNGGQLAYISRVVGAGALASHRTFNDGFNARLSVNTSSHADDRDVVYLESIVGITVGSALVFSEEFAGTLVVETRLVRQYDAATNSVTLDDRLATRYTSVRCTVTMAGTTVPEGAGSGPSLRVEARNEGTWGNQLEVTPMISYGATGLSAAATVDAETALTPVGLAFAAGPPRSANSLTLVADPGFPDGAAVVRFGSGGVFEIREVRTTGPVLKWDRPLANDYSELGSTVVQLSDVLRTTVDPDQRALVNNLPEGSAAEIELDDVAGVLAGDVLELRNDAAGEVELVVVAAVDDAGAVVTATADVEGPFQSANSTVTWFPSPRADVASAAGLSVGDLVRIRQGKQTQVLSIAGVDGTQLAFNAASHPLRRRYDAPSDETEAQHEGAVLVRSFAGSAATANVDLRSARNFYEHAVIEIDDGSQKSYHRVRSVIGDTLTLAENLADDVPDGAAVRVVELTLRIDDSVDTEEYAGLSLDPAAANYAPSVVNLKSRLVRVADESSVFDPPFNLPRANWGLADSTALRNGADGAPPTPNNYIGDDLGPAQRSGIKALADIDSIAIIAAPGASDGAVQSALLRQCEARKDRFAVLDPRRGSVIGSGGPDDIVVQRSAHDSQYGAIYYPWVRVRDPIDDSNSNGVLVPPSGHLVGIYARVDNTRGVYKAPANEVIRGLVDPGTPDAGPFEVKLSDGEQAVLNPASINVLRDFRNSQRGLRCWGARVITSENAWKDVPVRRLFIYVEKSMYLGLQWVVFEPNADALWAKVRRTVSGFLRRVWLDGALEGLTEAEAFFVRCDQTTMTPDDIANGRLIVLVGIAAVKPAEFVIIKVSQTTREATG